MSLSDQQLYAGDSNYPGEASSLKEGIEKRAIDFAWSLSGEIKRLRIRAGLPLNITKNSHTRLLVREHGSGRPWLAVWTEQTPAGKVVGCEARLLEHPPLYNPGRHD